MAIYMYIDNGGTGLGLKYTLIVAAIVSDIHLKSFNNSRRTSSPKGHRVQNLSKQKVPIKNYLCSQRAPALEGKNSFFIDLSVLLQRRLKVTGYSLRRVPRSKHDNSQCSLAPDYGYKDGAQIGRHLMRIHSQKEQVTLQELSIMGSQTFEPKSDQPSNRE